MVKESYQAEVSTFHSIAFIESKSDGIRESKTESSGKTNRRKNCTLAAKHLLHYSVFT